MRKVRLGVFETNSSATHTCVIMSTDDYVRWENNNNLYTFCSSYTWGWDDAPEKPERGKLYTKEDIIRMSKAAGKELFDEDYPFEDWVRDNDFINYEDWENLELETDHEYFETPSGDKMIVECKYGYDY